MNSSDFVFIGSCYLLCYCIPFCHFITMRKNTSDSSQSSFMPVVTPYVP